MGANARFNANASCLETGITRAARLRGINSDLRANLRYLFPTNTHLDPKFADQRK